MKGFAAFLCISLVAFAHSQSADDYRTSHSWYFSGFFGQSLHIFGSEDLRTGGGFSIGYGRPEPRFRYKTIPAQFLVEGYVDHTASAGHGGDEPNKTNAAGVLFMARYRFPTRVNFGTYFDIGMGLQAADKTTVDLNSQYNTTPVAGGGFTFRKGSKEWLVGLRFLHISNGGTHRPNQGQNQLYGTIAVRF